MPSWIGPWEIAIVVVIALLIFGPRKLPELGSSFGKSIRGFKTGPQGGSGRVEQVVAEVKEAVPRRELAREQGHHRRGDVHDHDRGGHVG